MGAGQHSTEQSPKDHKLEIWTQFCDRFMQQANTAEGWLNLDDLISTDDPEEYKS